jgi:hypothetical protein
MKDNDNDQREIKWRLNFWLVVLLSIAMALISRDDFWNWLTK